MIAGAANGTNLADGVDGLLAGTGIIALFTFMAMNVVSYVRSGHGRWHRNLTKLDLAIVGAALIGAAVGFLWFNAFPAEVIMGDTGSMAFGGALAAFAIMMKVEVLLLFIGGIFVIEALSVMIQVFSFKRFGRRVFLMAPIHHHFEMKAWSETKITVRFWIVGGPAVRGRASRSTTATTSASDERRRAWSGRCSMRRGWSRSEDVLVLGGGALALGAHERIGDGWVYVVRSQVDELEELLGRGARRRGERRGVPRRGGAGAAAAGRRGRRGARPDRDGGRGARRGSGGARARAVRRRACRASQSRTRRHGEELARSLVPPASRTSRSRKPAARPS